MKAQTSTEYLIILAIVIVIALVVVGVMGGIPTLGGQASSRTAEAYWAQTDLGITGYKVDADSGDDDQFVVKNNKRFTIKITDIQVNAVDITEGSDYTLSPGETVTLTATVGSGTAGNTFSYGVNATYDDEDNGITGYTFLPTEKLSGEYQ